MKAFVIVAAAAAFLGTAPRGAAHAAHARANVARIPVRAVVVSGNGQTARSYAAYGTTAYDAAFAKPLVVRIDGPGTPKGHPRHVVFTCEGCIFAGAEQHEFDGGDDPSTGSEHAKDDNGHTIPSAYDTKPVKGRFGVYVVLQAPVPAGTYRVLVQPVANAGERSVPTWFTLVTR